MSFPRECSHQYGNWNAPEQTVILRAGTRIISMCDTMPEHGGDTADQSVSMIPGIPIRLQ